MLIAKRTSDAARIDADNDAAADRNETFVCPDPDCGGLVTPKLRGLYVIRHFAHRPGTATVGCRAGEGPRHREMKRQLADLLGPSFIEFEAWLGPAGNERRADLLAAAPFGDFVIECQASPLQDHGPVDEICARTRAHNQLGRAVLWVWDLAYLLHDADCKTRCVEEIVDPRPDAKAIGWPEEVRTTPAQRWVHKASFGRTYGLDACGHLYAVHLETEMRAGDTWYDQDGSPQPGADFYPRTLRAVSLKPVAFGRVRLSRNRSESADTILLSDEPGQGQPRWWA